MFGTIAGLGKRQDAGLLKRQDLRLPEVTLAFAHAILIWAPRRNDTVSNREQVPIGLPSLLSSHESLLNTSNPAKGYVDVLSLCHGIHWE